MQRGIVGFPCDKRSAMRLALILLCLLLAACEPKPSPETIERVRADVDRVFAEADPMCIYQGPFPWTYRQYTIGCDRCEQLIRAGLVVKQQRDGEAVFELTADGKALYRQDVDIPYRELVEARRRGQGLTADASLNERIYKRPRLCFAKTRFHSITAMLAPMKNGSETFQSFKVVSELSEIDDRLYAPTNAFFTAGCNRRPAAGQPALCDPAIFTFVYYDGQVELRNDVRYGAWVNEP
jgi:hypothetical protein